MNKEERLALLKEKIAKAKEKAAKGESSFLTVLEKSTNKYFEISVFGGEENITIDAPEGMFSPEELEKLSKSFSEKGTKHKAAIGLTIWVESPEEAAELIEEAFKALGVPDDYEIIIEEA